MSLEAVIVPKISKLDWDMRKYNLTEAELLAKYRQDKIPEEKIDKMVSSHYRQREAAHLLQKTFPSVPVIEENSFNTEVALQFQVVIGSGGDNHYEDIARYLEKQILVGFNTDPVTSHGKLLNFSVRDLDYLYRCIVEESFTIERWTRLQATLNGTKLPYLALAEIALQEFEGITPCRHILEYRNMKDDQKGSGLLICTGSGISGWENYATRRWAQSYLKDFPSFPRTAPKGRFLLREDMQGDHFIGDFEAGETLVLTSLNSEEGVLYLDSKKKDSRFRFPFPGGARAEISLDLEHPLLVAVKN